jgi:hypothetical protein
MNPVQGYYAVVQYCPDPSRLEAANVGVVLFCPSIGFLKVRLARDNERIRRFFGPIDDQLVVAAKDALVNRLRVDAKSFGTVDDLEAYAARRDNEVRLTPLRAVKVADAETELEALFRRLVGERSSRRRAGSARAVLSDRLKREGLTHVLRKSIRVALPRLDREIRVPYGYKNGRFNLIEPVNFISPGAAFATACTRAVEGEALYATRHPELGSLKLIVVGQFGSESRREEARVRKLLADHHVGFYSMDRLKPLLDDIKAHVQASALQ